MTPGSCYWCCPSCMDTCLCFLFCWLFPFCLQFTVAMCWSDRGPVPLCDWIFWGLEFLDAPWLDTALPKTVLSHCFFLVQLALSFVVAKEGPYQDRPPLCPFRLLPLLIYSGSTIAFLEFQGP